MFFWRFYVKGSIKLHLPKYYISNQVAEDAINKAATRKGYKATIIQLDR